MKLENFVFGLFISMFCMSTTFAHPGHHEHSDLQDALIHHITSFYHSMMSLAILGAVMLLMGLIVSFRKSVRTGNLASLAQRIMGAALSVVGAGLLLGNL